MVAPVWEKEKLRMESWRPRGSLDSKVQYAYIVEALCPKVKDHSVIKKKLSPPQRTQIITNSSRKSLRQLAREYNVSYETIRRMIKRAPDF